MLKLKKVMFEFFLLCLVASAERVEIFRRGRVIDFYVKQNYQAAIEFPEPISQVITSYPEGVATYSVSDNKFFFLLSGSWEGIIFVIGESGQTYPVRVRQVIDNPDIVLKVEARVSSTKFSLSSQMENALKQLLQEHIQDGTEEVLNDKVFYKDKNIVIKGKKLFRFTSGFTGVIGEITNISKTDIVIPTTQISIPGLVAISIDKEYLKPEEKTKGYFLFKGSE